MEYTELDELKQIRKALLRIADALDRAHPPVIVPTVDAPPDDSAVRRVTQADHAKWEKEDQERTNLMR